MVGTKVRLQRPEVEFVDETLFTLSPAELVPALRRQQASIGTQPVYNGSRAAAYLGEMVANEFFDRSLVVEALPLYRETLVEYERLLGAGHELTTHVVNNVVTCLSILGRNRSAEALPLAERALASYTRLFGEKSPDALSANHILATFRCELGDFEGAQTLLRKSQKELDRLAKKAGLPPGAPPPKLLTLWSNTSNAQVTVLSAQGKMEEAERLLVDNIKALEAAPLSRDEVEGRGPHRLDTEYYITKRQAHLAELLNDRGDLVAAEPLFRRALPKLRGKSDYGKYCHSFGLLLNKRGLNTEARKYLDLAEEVNRNYYGSANRETKVAEKNRSELETSLRTCTRCGPVKADVVMKVCSACKAARYCCAACQLDDWKEHKAECKRIAAESAAASGSGDAGPSRDAN